MKIFSWVWPLFGVAMLSISTVYAAQEFPHRAKYKDVKIISLERLTKIRQEVTVVDVRSRYEFDTLHIVGAKHIPLNHERFSGLVKNLDISTIKPLVFYCNGHTCSKSYKAARQAKLGGVKKVFAFDAGVFDWAKANPKKTVLLGKESISVSDLIGKKKLNEHMLSPKAFGKKIDGNAILIDVRDKSQRDIIIYPYREVKITLHEEDTFNRMVSKAKRENKTLLIYDKVGKQVRWIQYRLEKQGVKKYFFMRGGAEGFFEDILGAS